MQILEMCQNIFLRRKKLYGRSHGTGRLLWWILFFNDAFLIIGSKSWKLRRTAALLLRNGSDKPLKHSITFCFLRHCRPTKYDKYDGRIRTRATPAAAIFATEVLSFRVLSHLDRPLILIRLPYTFISFANYFFVIANPDVLVSNTCKAFVHSPANFLILVSSVERGRLGYNTMGWLKIRSLIIFLVLIWCEGCHFCGFLWTACSYCW